MNHLIIQERLETEIICDSSGTGGYHIGSPPDQRMSKAAAAQGIALVGEARQFRRSDFEDFDLILAMDQDNYRDILALDSKGIYEDKVKLMCDFASQHPEKDVPDPYFGGEDGFNYVIRLLQDACHGLLEYLQDKSLVTGRKQG